MEGGNEGGKDEAKKETSSIGYARGPSPPSLACSAVQVNSDSGKEGTGGAVCPSPNCGSTAAHGATQWRSTCQKAGDEYLPLRISHSPP